ncbi:MAG TPA: N-acetylmuramoyl-L-alanine amidase [Acetivibrio sp.]|jgi:N-acetylmuramoyl-L-alanine amidase|nr:N-acetylmuramoyl-L-alanine amidase [Clostridium sp.]HOQ36406.1 N-acetylmuramoyl-L-alanine amidase [Acetivibrio sp.]HQA56454.1 N-acetylmuramoyl-L-alanine amidase [Acetivibrio sp.]
MKKLAMILAVLVTVLILSVTGFASGYNYSGYWCIPSDAAIAVEGSVIHPERQPITIDGRILVPARSTFELIGVRTNWYPEREVVMMTKGSNSITMNIGKKAAYVNENKKDMEAPAVLVNGTVMVPIRFVAENFGYNVGWNDINRMAFIGIAAELPSRGGGLSSNRTYKVVIDAGHGGSQSGAVYGGVMEKNLNLDIAKRLDALLKKEGIQTYMTRTNDSTVSLYARSGLANSVGADLLISIHNNAGQSKVSGSMTLYYPGSGKTKGNLSSYEFAKIVQSNLVKHLGTKDMGVIQRPNLAVLRTSNMPAVIAEVGYMSNSAELANLKTESFRQRAAEALRNAALQSLNKMYQ